MAPCPGEPAPPDVAGDRALALWVNDVRSAGRECRLKHACLARWARGESVEADDACKVERPGR